MEAAKLRVQMLGDFSLRAGDNQISDTEGRSRKVWLLLAYMIYNRDRTVSQEELVEVLWGKEPRSSNPTSALKTTFHRVRSLLDQLWPNAGHHLILRQDGGYKWNTEISMSIDADEFERLCRNGIMEDSALEQDLLDALELYQGDFLTRLAADAWVVPITAYYHNLYLDAILKVMPILSEYGRYREMERLCREALVLEPIHEGIYRYLMRAMLELGDAKGVMALYEDLCKQLFTEFGVMPEEETRALSREATRTVNEAPLPMEIIHEQLRESETSTGALVCEYDFFRVLCHSAARSMARSGIATHIALISVSSRKGEDLVKRSLERAMENLEDQIRISLRRGDAVARCSGSQYILMLPQANYENSCMVCERIVGAFSRRYPHSPVQLQYAVHPLEPIL